MRGIYLEARRGALLIVARAMWAKHQRFGVRSLDMLPVDPIFSDVEVLVVGESVCVAERRNAA